MSLITGITIGQLLPIITTSLTFTAIGLVLTISGRRRNYRSATRHLERPVDHPSTPRQEER